MSRREPLLALAPQESTHAGLWLDRYLPDLDAQGAKQEHIAGLDRLKVPESYGAFFARWKAALEEMPDTLLAKATVRGRMIVGLGAESILETSVSLHRTYGVPLLPGSGLKGLAAAAAHRRLEDPAWRKAAAGQPIGTAHRLLFGDQESSGYVTFHDALWWPPETSDTLPLDLPLDLDVMTVHHSDYYLGQPAPPADWDNPVPVPFASAHGSYLLGLTGPPDWRNAAFTILKDALDHDGAGAKTAAGYGRMDVSPLVSASSPEAWESRVREIMISNAEQQVPRLLGDLKGETRRQAAQAILKHLGRPLRRPERQTRPWVQELIAAAEAS